MCLWRGMYGKNGQTCGIGALRTHRFHVDAAADAGKWNATCCRWGGVSGPAIVAGRRKNGDTGEKKHRGYDNNRTPGRGRSLAPPRTRLRPLFAVDDLLHTDAHTAKVQGDPIVRCTSYEPDYSRLSRIVQTQSLRFVYIKPYEKCFKHACHLVRTLQQHCSL